MKTGKKELRKYIAELKTLHATSATQLSAEIMARLETHPQFQQAKTVLMYHSLADEVNTHDFIRKWYASKRILLPVVKGEWLELYLLSLPITGKHSYRTFRHTYGRSTLLSISRAENAYRKIMLVMT